MDKQGRRRAKRDLRKISRGILWKSHGISLEYTKGYHSICRYVREFRPDLKADGYDLLRAFTGHTANPYDFRKSHTFRKPKNKPTTDAFLESFEWRKIRMQVLIRDGARCACCGATRYDGRQMHVDHIKPRKLFPELALDPKNLQVLCDVCNHGKGNWDQTDWREEFSEAVIGAKLRLVKNEG